MLVHRNSNKNDILLEQEGTHQFLLQQNVQIFYRFVIFYNDLNRFLFVYMDLSDTRNDKNKCAISHQ